MKEERGKLTVLYLTLNKLQFKNNADHRAINNLLTSVAVMPTGGYVNFSAADSETGQTKKSNVTSDATHLYQFVIGHTPADSERDTTN